MKDYDRQIGEILSRRELFAGFGVVGTAIVLGNFSCQVNSASANIVGFPPCVVRPEQTEGPYFVDEKINRSDIRSDPSNGSVKAGLPLEIEFRVSRITKDACQPLNDAMVDIWHCDAVGVYSDVEDRGFSTKGQKFLRGFQTTSKDGIARFTTIYPGWYPGRTVHIHFKVRSNSSGKNYEFTSQLYFNDAITDKVHAANPYSEKGQRRSKNDRDGIFRDGGDQLLLALTETKNGYKAMFEIGLQIN